MLKKIYAALGLMTKEDVLAMFTVDLETAEAVAKETGAPSVRGVLAFATIKGAPITVFTEGQAEYDGKMNERAEALASVPVIQKKTTETVEALRKQIAETEKRGEQKVADANVAANAAGARASEVANLINALK